MTLTILENGNIDAFLPMPTPLEIHQQVPISVQASDCVRSSRAAIEAILQGQDKRLLVVVGPCSIHDPIAGMDYARRLKILAEQLKDSLYIVMRVYFEKPRTTVGWKGYINDPFMNDSFCIQEGMTLARTFLHEVNRIGMPTGTEALDPISPQYLGDLVAWTAIGARTAESQTHREMASGLSTSVGFKNGTDGNVATAINGILSAARPHRFLGINAEGRSAVICTKGNAYGHLVLRGGPQPNYDHVSISAAAQAMRKAGIAVNIVVDCSHANSQKNPALQLSVLRDVVQQINNGQTAIRGVMLESFIESGNQAIPQDLSQLRYGCSVTDACLDWATTEQALREAAADLANNKSIRPT